MRKITLFLQNSQKKRAKTCVYLLFICNFAAVIIINRLICMKRLATSLFFCAATVLTAFAQQAIFDQRNIASPVLNTDGTVTFNLYAPAANEVKITGDFLPKQTVESPMGKWEVDGTAELTRGDNGLWSYTTSAALAPELYMYKFLVDGVDVLDPANIHRTRDVRMQMSNFIVTDHAGDAGDVYSAHNGVPHGDLHQMWYYSPKLGTTRRMSVYTPAVYRSSKEKLPVLYLLHGMGGDETAWLELGRTSQILDNLIAQGKCKPMIVVMTNGHVENNAAPGVDGPLTLVEACMTSPEAAPKRATPHLEPLAADPMTRGGMFPESFGDVQKFVEKNFRVKKGADNTAICGLSMGGYHSFMISQLYPKNFGYVGLFSAAITMADRDRTYEVLTKDKNYKKRLSKFFGANPHLYWIAIGNSDFLYEQNKDYRRWLDEQGFPYVYRESGDGHIWRNWRIYLTEFTQMLFK